MAKVTEANYAAKLRAAILNAAITGKLTGGTSGWKTVKLGEVADVQLGKMLDKTKNTGSEYRYLANISVRWGSFDLDNLKTTLFTDREVEKFALKKGDILMCEGGEPGRCAIWQEKDSDIKYQKALHRIRLKDDVPEYICIYFEAIHDSQLFVNSFTGSTIKHLPRERLLELELPLPPLAIQREIVGKVEELMGLVEIVQEGGAKIRELGEKARAKILDRAIHGALVAQDPAEPPAAVAASVTTPPYALPPNWKWVKLGEVCEICLDGDWIESKDQAPSGIRLIQTGNVGLGVYEDKGERAKYISEETFESLNCTEIFPGDVLISRLPSPVGRACILPKTNCRMITAVDCSIIRPKEVLLSKYLVFYASSQTYFNLINEKVTGTTRPRISRKNLESIYFPLPPLAEQKRIVEKVEAMMAALEGLGAGF